MSIIIKGIDLPEILHTDIRIYNDGRVMKIIGRNALSSIPRNMCAIQIPTPHGRLIDWDAFNDKLDIRYAEGRGKALAPTILEAEE